MNVFIPKESVLILFGNFESEKINKEISIGRNDQLIVAAIVETGASKWSQFRTV